MSNVEAGVLVRMRPRKYWRDVSLGVVFDASSAPFKISKRRWQRDESLKDSDRLFTRARVERITDDETTD